jgi:Uncharacterized conserved protein
MLLSEWLLEQAKQHGLGGGSVFRAIAGFGRHGVLHEEQFFELADDLPVKVEFPAARRPGRIAAAAGTRGRRRCDVCVFTGKLCAAQQTLISTNRPTARQA